MRHHIADNEHTGRTIEVKINVFLFETIDNKRKNRALEC